MVVDEQTTRMRVVGTESWRGHEKAISNRGWLGSFDKNQSGILTYAL